PQAEGEEEARPQGDKGVEKEGEEGRPQEEPGVLLPDDAGAPGKAQGATLPPVRGGELPQGGRSPVPGTTLDRGGNLREELLVEARGNAALGDAVAFECPHPPQVQGKTRPGKLAR